MDEPTLFDLWCSRCTRYLPVQDFAPSMRTNGAYCKECVSEYNRGYQRSQPRGCRRCTESFVQWSEAVGRGIHRTHCRDCYNTVCRERYARRILKRQQREVREARSDYQRPYDPETGKRPTGHRWRALRERVFTEESHCWICGVAVDMSVRGVTKMSPTVDHVQPLAFGGDFWDRDNLRLAHFSCNGRRGNRMWRERFEYLQQREQELVSRVAELETQLSNTRSLVG